MTDRKQWTHRGWCILNHMGEPWTPEFFHTQAEAERYLAGRKTELWVKGALDKHKVVPAICTIRLAAREKPGD